MTENKFDVTKYKAAAFDLDGTLLDLGKMSARTKQLIKLLCTRGICVIISTGRGLPIVPNEIKHTYGVHYIVSSSGACVTNLQNEKVLSHTPIEKNTAIEVLSCIRRYNGIANVIYPQLAVFTPKCLRVLKRKMINKKIKKIEAEIKSATKITWNIERYIKQAIFPIEKINGFFNSKKDCADAIVELTNTQKAEAITTMGYDIEITAFGVNKASGLKSICTDMGMSMNEIVAFGDSQNDVPMLQACGYSVVMGDADSEIKAIADYIAPDAANDGAARAACDLFLINY